MGLPPESLASVGLQPGDQIFFARNPDQGSAGVGCDPTLPNCGDTVLLESGTTYLLTRAGGGPLAHGNTPSQFLTTGGDVPATIEQTRPGGRLIDQGGFEGVAIANVLIVSTGSARNEPPVQPADRDTAPHVVDDG